MTASVGPEVLGLQVFGLVPTGLPPALAGLLAGGAVAVLGRMAVLGWAAGPSPDRRVWARSSTAPAGRRPGAPAGPRPVLVVLLGVGGVGVLGPAGLALAGAVPLARMLVRRRRTLQRAAARDRAVPDLVDLFVLAVSAGLPVPAALRAVARRAPPALRTDLDEAVRRLDLGVRVSEALAHLTTALPASAAGLVRTLDDGHRRGAPVVAELTAVAQVAADVRRRHAEAAARRLSVTLLFPLVGCVLPAAILVAVVPVLVTAVGSLGS